MTHNLKIWPIYFKPVKDGLKTFEVRVNDRPFMSGDYVVLREYEQGKGYSGQSLAFKIGYVLPISSDKVVFSLLALSKEDQKILGEIK